MANEWAARSLNLFTMDWKCKGQSLGVVMLFSFSGLADDDVNRCAIR
jgi:hypothetical protein